MKRIFSILMVILMLLTLVGCASEPQDVNLNFNSGSTILESQDQNQTNGGSNQQQNDAPMDHQQSNGNESKPENEIGGANSEPAGDQKPDQGEENESQAGKDDKNEVQQPERDEEPEDEKNPEKEPQKEESKEFPWITVCSYNVKVLYYDDINNANGEPMSKFNAVCAELRKINADIVGLQELERFSQISGKDVDQLKVLAEELGYPYYHYTKTIQSSAGGGEYGHGVMSRYPIQSSEIFPFYEFYVDAPEPRAFSRHIIEIEGKELAFYNTHLAGPIPDQFDVITKKMAEDKENGLYAVVTGDMNIDPATLQPKANGCILLNTVENPQRTSVPDGWLFPPCDNIVVTDNLEYSWDDAKKTGITVINSTASDHKPIYTKIRFMG